MIAFLENLKALAFLLIFISSIVYYWQLKLLKRKRKLSKSEMAMYVINLIAPFTYAFIYIILLLGT
ncbi:hypothetical protein TMU01_18900 [Tenuibacillus multivorans]|uniref:Uncharacterized protein n=1 Tax=Tenuibacillus multivorans TaxID=237069 RepID=A0A1H0FHC0_9BACI|nr:hypothetical protein TMU01_18900 [Tenuibacillus multivorans]SDN93819.1 hypothetical protein SAMN05216498_0245 [Tenuibacillus multivorans]